MKWGDIGMKQSVLLSLIQIIAQPSCISCNIIEYIRRIISLEANRGDVVVFLETNSYDTKNQNRALLENNLSKSSCSFPVFSEVIQSAMDVLNHTFIFLNAKESNFTKEVSKIRSKKALIMIVWVHLYTESFSNLLLASTTRRVVSPYTKTIVVLEHENDAKKRTRKQVFKHVLNQITRYELFVFSKSDCEYILSKLYKFSKDSFHKDLDSMNWEVNGRFLNRLPTNFGGYEMKVVFPDSPPYVMMGMKNQPPHGVEIEIIRAITQYLNITSKYVPPPKILLTFSGKALSVLFSLSQYEGADIACGNLAFQSEYIDFISPLFPFSFRQKLFCAIRPIEIDKTRSLYGMLSKNVWFMVIATAVMSISVMFFVTKIHDGKATFMEHIIEVFGTHMDYGISKKVMANNSKTIVGIILLYAVILSTLYKANLKVSVTVPYLLPPLRSCLEAVQANLTFFLMAEEKPSLVHNPFHDIAIRKNRIFYFSDADADLEASKKNGAGVLFKDKDTLKYMLLTNDYSQHIVNFFDEYTATRPVSIIMAPGHPLLPVFDRVQRLLIEGGFPDYWHSKTFHSLSLKYKNLRNHDDKKPMTLDNLLTIFFLFSAMLIVDVFVFIVECLFCCCQGCICSNKKGKIK